MDESTPPNKNCILCMKLTSKTTRIFDKRSRTSNFAEILCQHFWFTFNTETEKSKRICVQCWQKTNAFHQFYESVREAHLLLQNEVTIPPKNVDKCDMQSDDDNCDMDSVMSLNDDIDKQTSEKLMMNEENKQIYDKPSMPLTKNPDHEVVKVETASDKLKPTSTTTTTDCDNSSNIEDRIAEYFQMNCDLCGQHMRSLNDVKAHFSTEHKSKRGYLICCCNKKVKMRRSIIEHIRWHMNPNMFRCDECSKTFNEKRALRNHMVTHRTKDEDRIDCHRCGKRFWNQRLLAEHTARVHPPDDQKFTCEICQKDFKLKQILEAHIKCMHSRTTQRYICDICAKVLSTKQNLKEHTNTHFDNPRVKCTVCGAMLKNRICLVTHMKGHTDTQQTCDICFQVKANRSALNNHKRRVHGTAKHKCNFCGKSFTRLSALREHIATHTGENLYTCNYCPQTFKSNSNMYKHMRQVHTKQWANDRKRR